MNVLEPSDYCDRRCDRCPLTNDCAVHEEDRRAREALLAEGLDDELTSLELQLIDPTLERALAGDDAMPFIMGYASLSRDEAIETYAFRQAGTEYALGATEVCASVEHGENAREALLVAYAICAKTSSIRFNVGRDGRVSCPDSSALTLQLVAELLREADAIFAQIGATLPRQGLKPLEAPREWLGYLLALQFSSISDAQRMIIRDRVASGRAPSPFCVAR